MCISPYCHPKTCYELFIKQNTVLRIMDSKLLLVCTLGIWQDYPGISSHHLSTIMSSMEGLRKCERIFTGYNEVSSKWYVSTWRVWEIKMFWTCVWWCKHINFGGLPLNIKRLCSIWNTLSHCIFKFKVPLSNCDICRYNKMAFEYLVSC